MLLIQPTIAATRLAAIFRLLALRTHRRRLEQSTHPDINRWRFEAKATRWLISGIACTAVWMILLWAAAE